MRCTFHVFLPASYPFDERGFFDEAPAVARVMWITIAIPSTTPRQVTSHGRSPSPCIAQLARRERALSALLAWTVGERAAVAGVEGLQEVGGLAAAHFADDDVIGAVAEGVLHQIADCDGAVLEPARLEADAVRGVDAELQRVFDRDDPLVVGDEGDERIEERRLAAPVPPLTRILRRVWRVRSAARRMCSGSAPWSTSCAAEKDRVPKRRTVIATCGLAGGTQIATREPSPRRASRTGMVAGSSPRCRGDVDRGAFQRRRVQPRARAICLSRPCLRARRCPAR